MQSRILVGVAIGESTHLQVLGAGASTAGGFAKHGKKSGTQPAVSGQVEGVGLEDFDRHQVKSSLVGPAQVKPGCHASLVGFEPAARTETPAVPLQKAPESRIRAGG